MVSTIRSPVLQWPQITDNQADQHAYCSWRLTCHCLNKQKYHRVRAPRSEQWVFGLVDTLQQPAVGYIEIVSRRDAQTLLRIIQAHKAPRTTIYSNEWWAYSTVGQLPNVSSHSTVNHSFYFVDPSTGVHTQHVESYWGRVKWTFKSWSLMLQTY